MFNQILAAAERDGLPAAGVVAASGGNAGLAAAYAARELGVAGRGVRAGHRAAGQGRQAAASWAPGWSRPAPSTPRRYAAAVGAADATGALFCHAYDDAGMVAGNGTLGLELLEQLPDGFDTVLVAVGGGGLIAGVIAALHGRGPGRRGRADHRRPPCTRRCAAGEPVDVPVSGVAADSLGARRAGRIAFETGPGRRRRHRCWSTTRRSSTPGGGCGTTIGSWSSTAPRRRRRR